jgi:hypothetical protein
VRTPRAISGFERARVAREWRRLRVDRHHYEIDLEIVGEELKSLPMSDP